MHQTKILFPLPVGDEGRFHIKNHSVQHLISQDLRKTSSGKIFQCVHKVHHFRLVYQPQSVKWPKNILEFLHTCYQCFFSAICMQISKYTLHHRSALRIDMQLLSSFWDANFLYCRLLTARGSKTRFKTRFKKFLGQNLKYSQDGSIYNPAFKSLKSK